MELSDLMGKYSKGLFCTGRTIEEIDSWRNPVKEVAAYSVFVDYADERGDKISVRSFNSMLKCANIRKEEMYYGS